MKKAKASLKKSNNIKPTKGKAAPYPMTGRIAGSVKKLARGLVKAMSPNKAKKPMAKAPPKAAPAKAALAKAAPVKAASPKAAPAKAAPAKAAPAKSAPAGKPVAPASAKGKAHAAPAKVAAAAPAKKDLGKSAKLPKENSAGNNVDNTKSAQKSQGKTPPVKPLLAKGAPVQAAVLTKPAKGEPKSKTSKLTAAQLAEHLEKMCRETACENFATTKGYCRLDYIKNWKKIKRKEMILKEGKLNQYIEELVSKYPEKYIDVIRQDLQTEVNFNKVIHDLELDESIDDLDYDGDSIDALIGGIKKDSEDFGGEDEF